MARARPSFNAWPALVACLSRACRALVARVARLSPLPTVRYTGAMKFLVCAVILVAACIPAASAWAAGPVALGPNNGQYGDWTAATYTSGAGKICYAFTTGQGTGRNAAMLTVTERASARDEVTLTAGFTYPKDAKVALAVGTQSFDFYTKDSTAYTTAGTQAVTALKAGDTATATATGPKGKPVTDSFSLKGVSGALAAITAACP
jgi:invasion protein IalB